MARRGMSIALGTVILLATGATLGQGGGPEAKNKGQSAFTGKALFVVLGGAVPDHFFLEEPQVKTLGERSFLVGRTIDGQRRLWLPVAAIARIEEFADVEEMSKIYSIQRPNKKK